MCKTRCSERDVPYEHFYLDFQFNVETLEIVNGTNRSTNMFDEVFTKGWDSNSRKEATAYINSLTSFEFIVGITSFYRLLHPVASTAQKLQDRTIDTVKTYQEVQSCILDMPVVRDKIQEELLVIYRQAERIALSPGVSPSVPRTISRQMNRSNIQASTPEEYYRRVLAIAVLDTFTAEMEFRFNELNYRASTLLTLIPSIITKPEYHGDTMANLFGLYRNDLPNPDIVDQELPLWMRKWFSSSTKSRHSTFPESVKKRDAKRFPNLSVLLKIGCKLPVTSW